MTKNLKEKAVKIQGKDYVLVSDRVIYFNETYPDGYIKTKLLTEPTSPTIVVKAFVSPDGKKVFTGHAQEVVGQGFINKSSALENAETSAVGRALAMMGIGVIDSIASVDEIKKAENRPQTTGQTIDQPTDSDLVCSVCGTQGKVSYKKDPNGRPYCPNWKEHNAKGEKFQMVGPVLPSVQVDEFFEDMPEEK